jgi:bifunctional non-homologous end joining protein LigD
LPVDTVILDGEIVALDEKGQSHFNLIQPRIHLSRPSDIAVADQQIPVYFYAFDILYINGYNLMKFPLLERKAVLRKVIAGSTGWVRFADHVENSGTEFFKAVEARGLEGIVAKLKKSPYQQARSRHWLKIKTQLTDHFVVGGFTPPEGSRKHFGALLLGLYQNGDLIYVGRSGGGFDDRALIETDKLLRPLINKKCPFKEVPAEVRRSTWVQPQLVCEVRFGEWTSDKKLRAPVFQGFRDDIDPKQCRLAESIPQTKIEQAEEIESSDDAESATSLPTITQSEPRQARTRRPHSRSKIEYTNLDKVLWPEDGYTKGDLINYYDQVSSFLIPHLLDRPLVFERFPDGIHGPSFYQKDAPNYTPSWIRTQELWSGDVERYIRYFIGADRDQLLYVANSANIQHNPWMSRVQHLDSPDYLVFDLDPVEAPFETVQNVAIVLKGVLDELGLRGYPKTSGASGIHVHLPVLEAKFTYEDVRIFAEAIASIVVARLPKFATIERVVRRRKAHEVYVDYLQNIKGKTVASVYSVRPRQAAPVSTPLKWEEFERPIDPKAFTIKTISKRLDKLGDLFEKALTDRQDIAPFLETLRRTPARKGVNSPRTSE